MTTSRYDSVARVGIDARLVRATRPKVSRWRQLITRSVALPIMLLFAVLVLATAAIVYMSWPLVFALVVVGAAAWCWHLDQEQDELTTTRAPLF